MTATVILVLLLQASANLYPRLLDCGRWANEYTKLCAALDCITRDLYVVPYDNSKWNKMESNEISWKKQQKMLGWRFNKSKLVRVEGSYNKKKKRWRTKTKSLAADLLSDCRFIINQSDGQIVGLTVVVTSTQNGHQTYFERTIALRTGVLV